jgi:hypothetical protein
MGREAIYTGESIVILCINRGVAGCWERETVFYWSVWDKALKMAFCCRFFGLYAGIFFCFLIRVIFCIELRCEIFLWCTGLPWYCQWCQYGADFLGGDLRNVCCSYYRKLLVNAVKPVQKFPSHRPVHLVGIRDY